jgi:RNA polymerase sigma-70 factor (ECF subfamily)
LLLQLSVAELIVELKKEQKLIRAAQKGDESAVADLYNAYADKIYRYFFYRVDSREVAEDLASEVFLRFVEGLAAYQDRNVPLLAWLYQIAHARLVDHYRQKPTLSTDENYESLEFSIEDDMDSELMITYQQEKVQTALRNLKDDQRQVLVLRFIEGYNLQQTAEALGKTIGAIKVIQYRALQSLNRTLVQQGMAYE